MPRYSFGDFIVSPRRRLLVHGGREIPLIPRYFDLLVFLIEHRREAVHRRDIFDHVWKDVIVSDSALSQAIRTIRRALGDDSREPRFIRTVSRHGYRFVFESIVEEDDDAAWVSGADGAPASSWSGGAAADPFEPLLDRLVAAPSGSMQEEERREAAEQLHALGTSEALARLGSRPGHPRARAVLRDSRWDVPQAGAVPIVGAPDPVAVTRELIALRMRRAVRLLAGRWAGATIGGALAGAAAGGIGGLILAAAPGSTAPVAVAPVLAVIGVVCGALGGAGVGAGLCLAEANARSWRSAALTCGAALGGGLVGTLVEWIGRWTLAALVGLTVDVHGSVEGLVIGGAAGAGYALSTSRAAGQIASPTGGYRSTVVALTAACCGLGALCLALAGRPLVGGTVHAIAHMAHGAQATLTPLARLIGEPDFGPLSQAVIATGEGSMFGLGLALGLTRRPRWVNGPDRS